MNAERMRELAKKDPAQAKLITERIFWENYCNAMIDGYKKLYTFIEAQGFDPEEILK